MGWQSHLQDDKTARRGEVDIVADPHRTKLGRVEGLPRGFRADIIAETGNTQDGAYVVQIKTGPVRIAWWRTFGRLIGIGRMIEVHG